MPTGEPTIHVSVGATGAVRSENMTTGQSIQQAAPEQQAGAKGQSSKRHNRTHQAQAGAQRRPIIPALGWFSIGLGVTQCLVPRQFARAIGVPPRTGLMRLLGLREITAGVGLLTQRQPVGWLWARVGGGMLDLTLLGSALTAKRAEKNTITGAMAATIGIMALDVVCSQAETRRAGGRLLHIKESISINLPPEDIYAFWRDIAQLPNSMPHITAVEIVAEQRSRWRVQAPGGRMVTWEAEIIDDQPNVQIAWRTLAGSQVEHHGSVRFAPAPTHRGTVVQVELDYLPPGGIFGAFVAKLTGRAPEQQIHKDLLHLKQVLETGEIPTTEGQPAGRTSSISQRWDVPARR
jgi:uncharacterized membrane protein